MTLVKLDNGDYINTEAVEVIKDGEPAYVGLRSNNSIDITPADRDRIVGATCGDSTKNKGGASDERHKRRNPRRRRVGIRGLAQGTGRGGKR